MANELKAHLRASRAGATVFARLVGDDGAIEGAPIPMAESPSIAALFVGSVPAGTPAGVYAVRVSVGGTFVLAGEIEWSGTEELRPLGSQILEIKARVGHRRKSSRFGTTSVVETIYAEDNETPLYFMHWRTSGGAPVETFPGVQTETIPVPSEDPADWDLPE